MNNASKAHIVVVDDDQLVRESLCDCVESAGYSVEGFASAEEFLASNSDPNTACMILDIQLPGETGLELQRRLRNAAGPPIVFVTAHVTRNWTAGFAEDIWSTPEADRSSRKARNCASGFWDANRERAAKLGAKGFLSKPVRCQDLLNAVRAAIPS
jgi:FixJ family two-component response regulator